MVQKKFTLRQALDYLDNLERSSDSEEESLSGLQSVKIYLQPPRSIPVDETVMLLILVMKTQQQQQISVILDSFRHFTSNWF